MTDEQKAKAMEMQMKCAEELHMSPEDINKLKSHDLAGITNKVRF